MGRCTGRHLTCELTCAGTQERGLSSATGCFAARDSHAAMSCSDIGEHIQVPMSYPLLSFSLSFCRLYKLWPASRACLLYRPNLLYSVAQMDMVVALWWCLIYYQLRTFFSSSPMCTSKIHVTAYWICYWSIGSEFKWWLIHLLSSVVYQCKEKHLPNE